MKILDQKQSVQENLEYEEQRTGRYNFCPVPEFLSFILKPK